ncbi:MAG: uncharacterized protein A8A55_2919 [Amphiamblys sp. WSBS2006]|nr:MAG: uncharacterized protein A8A55_2919 [Amphiamblys sp. WSBS2006]
METRATETLKLGNTFFVFTHQSLFLVPPNEYERIQQDEDGYVCLERKYITGIASRNTERVICIVCHGKAAPEDLVFPLCRQMHFVICEECVEDLQEKTNKREIFCPYCKEEQDKKASQEKILSAVLSLMSHQTLHSLEINPNTEVETVTRLSQETKVFLSNVCVSDALFFNLLSKTVVEITNRITLFAHETTLLIAVVRSLMR